MHQLHLDCGIQEYHITGGGTLRFNPGDPNLYARFLNAVETISKMEKELQEQAAALPAGDPEAAIGLMTQADTRLKTLLGQVFGEGNDFHRALGGVSLLAVASNGQPVIANLLAALEPLLSEGAQKLVDARVEALGAQP